MNSYLPKLLLGVTKPATLLSENQNIPRASNPIAYPKSLILSKLAFLVNLPAPNKELPNVKSTLYLNDYKFISYRI